MNRYFALQLFLFGFTALTPSLTLAQSLPSAGSFVAGSGTISKAGTAMTVTQSTARGVINWQGFSIASGHSVQFENGSGATLNRVTGAQMSELQGHLGATGSLYLINPNGVVIGPNGSVATGGSFVASTRDTTDSAFMKGGSLAFSGNSSGTVKNEGRITSTNGNVVLVGQSVTNSGTVNAANGTVALAAGNKVILSEAEGPDGIYVETDATAKGDVTNTGHIQAAAATLAAAGGNVYALAGNRDGLIQATGTRTVNGQIWLTAPQGKVTVEDTTVTATTQDGAGGTIRANGHEVGLGSRAVLDASATKSGKQGGHVLVGTDAMGGVNLATRTTIASGATLKARGKDHGAGGEIETSAHTMELGNATIDAGAGGQWLLDPDDLTIDANAADTISSTLNSGTDVTQETTATTATGAGTSAAGNGDIILDAPISWSSGSTLLLSAYRNITLNAGINISGSGKLTLNTNNSNQLGGAATSINYNNGSAISFDNVSMSSSASSSPLNINGTSYTLISNLTELQSITQTGNYALVQSINASGSSNFTPIGGSNGFTSLNFDGLGNTISNISISSNLTQVGLFSYVSGGNIKNIGVINGNVTGTGSANSRSVGGILGVSNNNTSIDHSYFIGNVNDTGSGARGNIGGLVGYNNGNITNSFSSGTVTVSTSSTGSRSGGLVGINYVGIESSYSNSTVSTSDATGTVGGLVGLNSGGTVNNAYSIGNVTGASGYIGGLIGQSFQNSNVTNVYAAGEVTSTTGSNSLGGLIGTNSASVSNGYWNTDNVNSGIGSGSSSGEVGLTTKEWLTNGPLVSGSGNIFSDSTAWVNGSLYPVLGNLPYIRVTATSSQTYGSSNISVSNISYIDQSGNDASSKVSGSISWHSPVSSSSSNVGSTGLIYGTGISASGYQIVYNALNTINPATLSITASNQNGTYGQTPALGDAAFTTSGLVNGDTVSAVTLATDATSRSAVGSYGITASNAQGSGLSNYTIGYLP
ncbi:two-partner secretion domain-containing protein, partial [Asaia spathodeae]